MLFRMQDKQLRARAKLSHLYGNAQQWHGTQIVCSHRVDEGRRLVEHEAQHKDHTLPELERVRDLAWEWFYHGGVCARAYGMQALYSSYGRDGSALDENGQALYGLVGELISMTGCYDYGDSEEEAPFWLVEIQKVIEILKF
jgi:hypothetical protein